MESAQMILREVVYAPLTTKGTELEFAELDGNFVKIYQDIKALNGSDSVPVWDSDTTYNPGPKVFVSYSGLVWRYINSSPSVGVTPGSDEDYWIQYAPVLLAHVQNTDTKLAEGTDDEITAAQLKELVVAGGPDSIHRFNTISSSIQDYVHEFSVTTDSELIREIGNLFIDDNGDRYFTYSANASPYNDTNQPWIYCVKSVDGGKTWIELGKITAKGFEDPYLVKFNGEYFLYTEKKVTQQHDGINLHKGPTVTSLVDQGIVITSPLSTGYWDSLDRSSPTVIVLEDEFVMLFEGRAPSNQQGAVGKATSPDGINWTIENDPSIVGYEYAYGNPFNLRLSYISHLVPDTITKVGDKYLLSFHGYNGNSFTTILLLTEDFINYEDYLGTWIGIGLENREVNGSGIAVFTDGIFLKALMTSRKENNVLNPYILQEAAFSVKNGNYSRYSVKTTGIYKIVPAQRSEFILFNSTSPTSATLANDLNSGAGLVKTIKNTKTGDVTINCETGVTIDGSNSLIIAKDTEITLVSTAVNAWTVFSKRTKGVSGTYNFDTSAPGQVSSIAIVDGIITGVTLSV